MIVNSITKGWEIIYQRAHGLLAVDIAQHWQKKSRPARWVETLAAVTEHDDAQEAWHAHYHLSDVGAPQDFTLQPFSLQQAQAITRMAAYKSQWIGLLISSHITFLYESLRGKSKAIDDFLDEQKQHQAKWKKELNLDKNAIEMAYGLLQWCDRCSLILCKGDLPEAQRDLEIFTMPDGIQYFIKQRNDQSISVKPWPFEINEFEVMVESRALRQLQFKDDKALELALKNAPVEYKKWIFKR